MERLSTTQYHVLLAKAVRHFWETRASQQRHQKKIDQALLEIISIIEQKKRWAVQ